MEFLQLKYFCAAAKLENFSRVAALYQIPASGISSSIKRLETELGVNLFIRTANTIKLTERGKLFFEETQRALDIMDRAKARVSQIGNFSGKVILYLRACHSVVEKIIVEFKQEYPDIDFEIKTDSAPVSNYDLIISDEMLYVKGCDKKVFRTEKMLLVAPKEHCILQQDSIDLELLKKQKFITTAIGTSIYHHTCRTCFENGFVPNITIYTGSTEELLRYIQAGCGIGILPELAFDKIYADTLAAKPFFDFTRNTCIFYERNRARTKAVELFLDRLLEYAE